MLITTRASTIIGDEIKTSELDMKESIDFLFKYLSNEFPNFDTRRLQEEFNLEYNQEKFYEITSGRPLFIIQFAFIFTQCGSLKDAIKIDIKSSFQAIEFLYGRIYEYLSRDAKNLFVGISLLVNESDLTNLLDKLCYILNLENNKERFNNAVKELEKLKIIEIHEDKFFKIYSKEILQIMNSFFQQKSENFKRNAQSRLHQITRDKKLDTEHALLLNADNSRSIKTEEEVISLYRHILNRPTSPQNVKLRAIINLTTYLFADRGKKDEAIKTFDDYKHLFENDALFIRNYANFCWAKGFKEKSISILLEYFKNKPNLDDEINLELLGLLLMYRSIYFIDLREQTKIKYNFEEIDKYEYRRQMGEQKKYFLDIYSNQGLTLFNRISTKISLDDLRSGTRQNIISGLYQFTEICIRLNKYNEAAMICEYAIKNLPVHFHQQFKNKKRRINYYIKNSKSNSAGK